MKKLLEYFGITKTQAHSKKACGTETTKLKEQVMWKPPVKLKVDIPKEEIFTPEHLPKSIRSYVFSNALRLNDSSPEFIAASVITSAAAIIGGSAVIQPKRNDTNWLVVPTIWSGLVADPSKMKSPSIDVGTSLIPSFSSAEPEGKTRSIVINDVTKEALTMKLVENPLGMLFCRDELAGWLIGLDKESRASERGFFLSAFNGNVAHKESRVQRGDTDLEAIIISLIGGIQPSMLSPLLKLRFEGKNNDGLFERMQLLFYSDRNQKFMDIAPDLVAEKDARHAFQRLLIFRETNNRTRFILCDEGQQLLNCLGAEITERLNNEDKPHIQAVIGKYHALCAKLALVFHLLSENDYSQVIGVENVKIAIKWMPLLEYHYHKVMSLAVKPTKVEASESLLGKLQNLQDGFSKRDLVRKNWSGLTDDANCRKAIACLVEHGYLIEVSERPKGKLKVSYLIHPDYK